MKAQLIRWCKEHDVVMWGDKCAYATERRKVTPCREGPRRILIDVNPDQLKGEVQWTD